MLRTLDVMAGTDRPDAIASSDADAEDAVPVDDSEGVELDGLSAGSSGPSSPAIDDSGPVARGPAAPTHQLLESEPASEVADGERPAAEPEPAQVVSGDPLLRAPAPTTTGSTPLPPKPPPTTDMLTNRAVTSTVVGPKPVSSLGSTGSTTIVPGTSPPSTDQPARRAARGAHVVTPRVATPPTRPPDQPVATLRPTTVAPVPRMAGRRPRVRRVTRVVRHVDPWSVFKVAAAFSIVAYAITLVAGVLLWNVAYATGTIDNIERGMESTGWEVFELDGGEIFHNAWIGGLFGAVALTGLAVLVATLFNLITDLVGGIRLTVLEEEVIEKTASPMRRFATAPGRQPTPNAASQTTPQGAEARVRRARGG